MTPEVTPQEWQDWAKARRYFNQKARKTHPYVFSCLSIMLAGHEIREVAKWCTENISGSYMHGEYIADSPPGVGSTNPSFFFKNEADAALFRLTWL